MYAYVRERCSTGATVRACANVAHSRTAKRPNPVELYSSQQPTCCFVHTANLCGSDNQNLLKTRYTHNPATRKPNMQAHVDDSITASKTGSTEYTHTALLDITLWIAQQRSRRLNQQSSPCLCQPPIGRPWTTTAFSWSDRLLCSLER